ncbi:MAG: polyphosphate kinase 2 family protein, partial [Akkermansiaceae bacterium]|nr:polyphosphate kinase 2 family protein [Akkermansiaceae bacterium]
RLEARLVNPAKHWKFNPDDLADRALWGEFMEAYEDLIERTSQKHAPWYIIPADRKWYRNLCVARIMVDTLRSLDMKYPKIGWDPSKVTIDGKKPDLSGTEAPAPPAEGGEDKKSGSQRKPMAEAEGVG